MMPDKKKTERERERESSVFPVFELVHFVSDNSSVILPLMFGCWLMSAL